MKKFLIIVIFFIPIIVVFALSATSNILSMATPDNPTDIMIRDSFNEVVERDSIINLDVKTQNEFIMVDILPFMTKEDGINELEFDENNSGEVKLELIPGTNKYRVIPIKIGIATVIISAKANVNVRRAVTFNIKSESIERICVYAVSPSYGLSGLDADEQIFEVQEEGVLEISENTTLYADIYPIEALKESQMYWRVVDGDSVRVTPNGYLSIQKRGISQVRVSARDRNMNYSVFDVIVDTSSAIVRGRSAFVEEEEASAKWVEENLVLDPVNSVVSLVSPLLYKVNYTNPETLEERNSYIKLTQANKNDWDFVDTFEKIYTNNGPYFLNIKESLSGKIIEDVEFFSSDSSVVKIDLLNGVMIPLKAGQVVIFAEYKGKRKEMEITVREKVPAFSITYGTEHSKLGIQLTRKWGNKWLNENNEIINTFEFGLIDKRNTFDVIWESSDSEGIEIVREEGTQDVVLNFTDESIGKSINITAFLEVNGRKYDYIKSSFTFNIMQDAHYVNVDNFEEIMFLNFDEEYNICMQSDIFATEPVNYNTGVSFYGNGFTYNSCGVSDEDFNYLFIGAINIFRDPYNWSGSGLRIPDGKQLQDRRFVEREITFEEISFLNAPSFEESYYRGAGVFIFDFRADALISFKYVQAKNGEYGIAVKQGRRVLVEGCILGDNSTYSLYSEWVNEKDNDFYGRGLKPTMTIRNNVFKHSDGPAVCFLYNSGLNPEDLEYNYMPELYIEGFMDAYNWHSPDSFTNMFSKIIVRALSDSFGMDEQTGGTMRKMLNSAFADYFKVPELSRLYYTYNGKKYVSVGILAMGAIFKPNIEKIHCEDPRLRVDQIIMVDSEGKPLTPFISGLDMIVKRFINVETILNPSVFVVYDSVGRTPAIMPGEPVPQSYELYARLTGVSEDLYIQG